MDPMISAIMGWGANFAPRLWAFCQGQLLPISSYQALYSLIGTTYGGDGRTTFALPDLRGRVPIGAGQSPGTSYWTQGARAGTETVTLTQVEMPVHNHPASTSGMETAIPALTAVGTAATPGNSLTLAQGTASVGPSTGSANVYGPASNADTNLSPAPVTGTVTIGNAGGSQPFSIVQPLQAIQFIIALEGIYPQRN